MDCMNYHDKQETKQQAARTNKGTCATCMIAEVAPGHGRERCNRAREIQHKKKRAREQHLHLQLHKTTCEQTHKGNTQVIARL